MSSSSAQRFRLERVVASDLARNLLARPMHGAVRLEGARALRSSRGRSIVVLVCVKGKSNQLLRRCWSNLYRCCLPTPQL
jgi:hypothetical protein